ncbi:MAG: hypothetical protein D6772_12715 [Bacteroidetes bacterium]|nr:MAG: hypothetical protein D6772_12715 [Bacteroidota bacterium]
MSEKSAQKLTLQLLQRDFELATTEKILSEEELLQLLADEVDHLIERRMEWLLSLMYRMDIEEARVQAALSPHAAEPANVGLARLILARQQQRVHTKQTYKPEKLGEEWEW